MYRIVWAAFRKTKHVNCKYIIGNISLNLNNPSSMKYWTQYIDIYSAFVFRKTE